MIILKSDYSPVAAPEKLEEDYLRMLQMLLVSAGISSESHFSPLLDNVDDVLTTAGITISNVLTKYDNEGALLSGYFSHITTTVYNDYANMEEIARIERPVTDIEAETYEENSTGYGADHG